MTGSAAARRVASFLPSATEMMYALGLGDRLVAVSHECDYPPDAKSKPVVVRPNLVPGLSQREIDAAVSGTLKSDGSLYRVDELRLAELAPDLVLTQDLCQVCAPSGNELARALSAFPSRPKILSMTPRSIAEIFDNVRDLGAATGHGDQAATLIDNWSARLAAVEARSNIRDRTPRVFCMEWLDPIYCAGHWVPEMVRLAGGTDALGREGSDSVRIGVEDVVRWQPEIVIVMPCGLSLQEVVDASARLSSIPGWSQLPAVGAGRVYAVDANSYFARPGPRIVEGTELLAHLIHPELFDWVGPSNAYCPLIAPRRGSPLAKHCSRCDVVFSCGPETGADTCWCQGLPPIRPETGEDCMCRACLAAEAAAQAQP